MRIYLYLSVVCCCCVLGRPLSFPASPAGASHSLGQSAGELISPVLAAGLPARSSQEDGFSELAGTTVLQVDPATMALPVREIRLSRRTQKQRRVTVNQTVQKTNQNILTRGYNVDAFYLNTENFTHPMREIIRQDRTKTMLHTCTWMSAPCRMFYLLMFMSVYT